MDDIGLLEYGNLKNKTISDNNIELCPDKYYHYVNHIDKLCTSGFISKQSLINWKDFIRFDKNTIPIFQDRYITLFGVQK